jgi:regulator of RNase E activity RraA
MPDSNGASALPPMTLDEKARSVLVELSTATITTVLLKNGFRNVWVRSSHALDPAAPRVAGRAFTMRFIPAREDRATPESLSSPRSTRGAIEDMPPGCIAVVDAMGTNNVGIFGDILCARMRKREVAALVTDGAMRDLAGVRNSGLPIWCNGIAAPPSVAGLTFVGWQEPVACGGVAVFPGDVMVADGDGAVVIPAALLDVVLTMAPDTEMVDSWVLGEVEAGRKLMGLYPPNEAATAEYNAWRARKTPDKA